MVGGEGWDQESCDALAGWATRHGVPVLADFRAYDAVPHSCDAYAGYLGYARSDANARRLDEADLLVFVGCVRADVLSDGYKRGLDAVTVVVNPGADLLGHFGRLDQHIPPTSRPSPTHSPPRNPPWARGRLVGRGPRRLPQVLLAPQPDGGTGVDLGVVMEILKQEMDDDAVITYGAGNHSLWPARYLKHNTRELPRRTRATGPWAWGSRRRWLPPWPTPAARSSPWPVTAAS